MSNPDHIKRVYENIIEMLSNEDNPTPLLRIQKAVPYKKARLYAKLEWYNPFGAVKDRVAANLVYEAEQDGLFDNINKLVEPTSGNTGMGLAMIANAKGYHLTTPLSTAIPAEKRTMLKVFGAELIEVEDSLCPMPGAPEGAIAKAMDLAEQPEYLMLNQYENEGNIRAHIKTTGPEIWKQTAGKITHFVAGMGTCGTITGNGRYLKGKNPNIKIIGVHPEAGHDIPGVRSLPQLQQTKLFKPDEYDQLIEVSNMEAFEKCLELNRTESLVAGPSSGMALAGALKVIDDEPGAVVVVIFPDNAFKYASSFAKHFPHLQVAGGGGGEGPKGQLLDKLIEANRNPSNTIEADDLEEVIAADSSRVLIDVRSPEQYQAGHVPYSINIPIAELDSSPLLPNFDREVVTICNLGNMSIRGMMMLNSMGYHNVKSLNGGALGWGDAGKQLD